MALQAHNSASPVEYAGLVLDVTEVNGRDDSDYYATVWDLETGKPKRVLYQTTRAASYGWAEIDATPEVRAAYEAYRVESQRQHLAYMAELEAAIPSKGKSVQVVHGRKIPIGAEGEVIWFGSRTYNHNKVDRVGVRLQDGSTVWTSANNVKVLR